MASQLGRPELVIDEKNDTKADAGYGNFGTHIARRVQDAIKVGKKPAPWWQWCLRDLLGFEFEPEQYHVIVGVTDDWHTYCRREFSLKHSGRDFDFEGSRVVMLSSIHRLWDHLTNLRRPGSEKYYSGQIHIWIAVDFGYKLFWPVPPAYFHSGGGISFHGQSPSGKRLVTMISRQPRESAAQWLHEIDYVDALATKPIPHVEQRSNTPDSGYSSSDSRGADSDHETRSRRRSRNVRNKSSGGSPMANQDSRNQSEKQAPTEQKAQHTNNPAQSTEDASENIVTAVNSNVLLNNSPVVNPTARQMDSQSDTVGCEQLSGNTGSKLEGRRKPLGTIPED